MTTYRAESLEDIARHFTNMAAKAAVSAGHTTGAQKKLLDREAVIWGRAASMLRQTTITKAEADDLMVAFSKLDPAP